MPPDLIQRLTIFGGFLPGAVSLLLLGVFWWMHKRRAASPNDAGKPAGAGPRWVLPLVLAGGFFVSDYVVKGAFVWWPKDNTMRAGHAALLLGAFGLVEGLVRMPRWAGMLGRAGVLGAMAWVLIEAYVPSAFSTAQMWGVVAAVGFGGSLIAEAADRGTEKSPGWPGALAWIIAVAGVMPLFKLAGFASGSMALTGVIAALTSGLIVSVVVKDFRLSRGGVTVIVGLLLAGVLGAGIQSEPKSVTALLLLVAMPLVFVVNTGSAKRTLLVRAVAAGLIAGSAAALLFFGSSGGSSDGENASTSSWTP